MSTRRSVLGILAGGLAATSGCRTLALVEDPTLGQVLVGNDHAEPKEVSVRIERQGSLVLEETVTVSGDAETEPNGREIRCVWTGKRGPFTVRASAVGETEQITLDGRSGEVDVSIVVEEVDSTLHLALYPRRAHGRECTLTPTRE